MNRKPIMLMILDGFGINENEKGNAVKLANTPNIDKLMKTWPTTQIHTSGLAVGLPEGQMGNSEVGHTNIGAGRVVYQDLTRITKSIEDGEFFSIKELTAAIDNCKKYNSKLHIMGLLSDGGVHSHIRHLFAILELAKRKDFEDVYVHCFLDGRDTPPASGESYILQLEEKMKEKGVGKIASISGRFYSMDRDKRWDRVEKAYKALVYGEGEKATSAISGIEASYQKEVFDEFVEPTVIYNGEEPIATIDNHDSVIFFNFRPDRAREITRSLVDPEFDGFEVKTLDLYYVCFTQYDETIPNVQIAFKPEVLVNTFGEYVSKKGLTQLRIAETEKYAHVTYFFDGGRDLDLNLCDRVLIPSPKVATYDLKPEMSAREITSNLLEKMDNNYDFIFLNFANGDMVGHTGNYDMTKKAIETIDEMIGKLYKKCVEDEYLFIITADHGNAEEMIDENGNVVTSHTTNLVPFIVTDKNLNIDNVNKLSDIAPFVLNYMNLNLPDEMK